MRGRMTASAAVVIAWAVPMIVAAPVATSGPAADAARQIGAQANPTLPLGPAGLPQTATSEQLAAGVTQTRIVRGAMSAQTPWVVELSIPALNDPDPDAPAKAIQDAATAQSFVDDLTAAGLPARAEPVTQSATADLPEQLIGQRVRLVETFSTRQQAQAKVAEVRAAGFSARDWYRGWDGGSADSGQWTVNVITIDPKDFTGTLGATFGPDLAISETVSSLAQRVDALAAVNAGFFVFSGDAPGDPAGIGIYDGAPASEPVGERPALVLRADGRGTSIVRPDWSATLSGLTAGPTRLDGVNRLPGSIRNCGGWDDLPTQLPLHDVTCTDDGELVAFTTEFAARTPSGTGREVVIDGTGRVVRNEPVRGTALAAGERSIQAIGDRVTELDRVRVASRLQVTTRVTAPKVGSLLRPGISVVNGGPELVRDGRDHVTQAEDGMWRATDPSFAYGWVLQRNPRTIAGVDALGRTVLVTVDGRQVDQLGLSIQEAADVAQALGLRDAINLDGGGSTEMAVRGAVVNSPSDGRERAVGDAIYVK